MSKRLPDCVICRPLAELAIQEGKLGYMRCRTCVEYTHDRDEVHGWESIERTDPGVRRFRVPGGWLYQVALEITHEKMVEGEAPTKTFGWSVPPVFVPEAS